MNNKAFVSYPKEKDKIVELVKEDLDRRSAVGLIKYGTSLAESNLSVKDFLQHALEESMDLSLYLKSAIIELEKKNK